jgi:hypothetical protein
MEVTEPTIRCAGCGALVPNVDGPVHKYVPSAPGCWKTFGEVQADEALRFRYPPAHRIVVDAYMAQHPGDGTDRRDRQSVFVHLVGLYAVLVRGMPPAQATAAFRRLLRDRDDFPQLRRTGDPGSLTVMHIVGARDRDDYDTRAREWGQAVWESWTEHHQLIRAALEQAF